MSRFAILVDMIKVNHYSPKMVCFTHPLIERLMRDKISLMSGLTLPILQCLTAKIKSRLIRPDSSIAKIGKGSTWNLQEWKGVHVAMGSLVKEPHGNSQRLGLKR